MPGRLGVLDWAILAAYLVGTLWIGLKVGQKLKTGDDYFLAGRKLPWWAVGFSLVATDIGATDITGGGGSAYSAGFAVASFEWIGCVPAMIVAAFVFVPFFHRAGVTTIPEFMERRFSPAVRASLAVCLLAFMACNLGIMLFASAKMMTPLMGWNDMGWVIVTAVVVGIYTGAGGLAAVVYTDVLQCIIMILGCLAILALGLHQVGGLDALFHKVREIDRAAGSGLDRTALLQPADTPTPFPWSGILFGLAFVLSPAYWIGNQAIIQRSLGARSEFDAKASYVAGAVLKNVIPLIYALPGLIAIVLLPGLKNGDDALPTLASTVLPMGLRGLFLAAFLAALMSSVDSYLNSGATILTHDLYRRFYRPKADDAAVLRAGRITTVALLIFAVVFGLWLSKRAESGIYTIFQTLMAFFQGPLLALILAGVLWKRATAAGALAAFIAGIATSSLLFALNQESVCAKLGTKPLFAIQAPFLYFSIWSFVAASAAMVAVSLATKPRVEAAP